MEFINRQDHDALLRATFEKYKVKCELSERMFDIFHKMTNRLLEENEKYNLTAVRTPEGVIEHHIFDSILPTSLIPEGAHVLDVGSGGGFPSLPLATVRPDLKITALDSTEKKIEYIKTTAEMLGLDNVSVICGRAEELTAVEKPSERIKHSELTAIAKQNPYRESFDVVIARSVASMATLSELCVPFLKVGGKFIAMKAEKAIHEAKESENALYLLGCVQKCEIIKPYTVDPESDKLFFVTSKRSGTPAKYPRRYNQIKKKPL